MCDLNLCQNSAKKPFHRPNTYTVMLLLLFVGVFFQFIYVFAYHYCFIISFTIILIIYSFMYRFVVAYIPQQLKIEDSNQVYTFLIFFFLFLSWWDELRHSYAVPKIRWDSNPHCAYDE